VANGEEDETIWVYLEERFGSKTSVHFGFFCFVCSFGVFVFVVAFLTARAVFVLIQNSSQSLPLLRVKFVISRKAWYVTGCLIGMEQGGMVYLDVGGMGKL